MVQPTLTYDPEQESFGDFLNRVRLGFGVKNEDFAKFLGVQQSALDRWRSGDTRYLHNSRKAAWAELGILLPDRTDEANSVLQQLRDEVDSLADDEGNLLYPESDLVETIEWIKIFKASEDTKPKAADMRAWAKAEGLDCPTRGRVPNRVKIAYRVAHASK